MRKIYILIIAISISITPAFAQKQTDEKIVYTYKQLALTPLPKNIRTYKAVVKNYHHKIGYMKKQKSGQVTYDKFIDDTQRYINKYLKIDGYRKQSGSADLTVTLSFENIKFNKKMKEQFDSKKNRVAATYYFNLPAKLTVKTTSGRVIYDKYIYNSNYQFSKRISHDQIVMGDRNFYIAENAIYGAFSNAEKILSNNYATPIIKKKTYIYGAKAKKHDYSDLTKANEDLILAVSKLSSNSKDTKAQNLLEKSIASYNKILGEADFENKKVRINYKVAGGIYHNLTFAYLLKKDFNKATESVNNAIAKEKLSKKK